MAHPVEPPTRAKARARRPRGWGPAAYQIDDSIAIAKQIAEAVSIADGRVTVGDPRRLFEARAAAGRSTFQAAYSVSVDGRFLVHLLDPRAIPTQINLVLNWFDELKQRVPSR